jgi:hypothetical protein
MNALAPSPLGEASRNGKLVFTLGYIPANRTSALYMEFQASCGGCSKGSRW